jgi:hypothetical protein
VTVQKPLFISPEARQAIRDITDAVLSKEETDGRCGSLKRVVLHKEGDHEVYLRCTVGAGHPGVNHKSWLKKWKTHEEDGRIS